MIRVVSHSVPMGVHKAACSSRVKIILSRSVQCVASLTFWCVFLRLLSFYCTDYVTFLYWFKFSNVVRHLSVLLDFYCFFFNRAGTLSGLLLIAIGTGGIKPCVAAYGADQFKPGQVRAGKKADYFVPTRKCHSAPVKYQSQTPDKIPHVRGMDPNYTHPFFAPNYTHPFFAPNYAHFWNLTFSETIQPNSALFGPPMCVVLIPSMKEN